MLEINPLRLEYLFERYFEGNCTEKEREELLHYMSEARHDEQVRQLMDRAWHLISPDYRLDDEQSNRILSDIFGQREKKRKKLFIRWSAAAAILLVLLIGIWMRFNGNGNVKPRLTMGTINGENDVAPGGKKAVLVLGNGSTLTLDSAHNGLVARQGGTPVIKLNGQLSYADAGQTNPSEKEIYNTIVTPKGGQYEVVLQDGTKVWLNAASSLRFPTFFSKDRKVELTGEAYFEVAPDRNKPFEVRVNDMEVTVLGTHFDVRAYENEGITRTALLEGAVKVSTVGSQVLLKPGQQASLTHSAISEIKVSQTDPEAVVAWKNGLFLFHQTDLETVMEEIARWYDVSVVYKGNAHRLLNGMISRNTNLSGVLHMLEITTDIRFLVDKREIIVIPPPEVK